MLYSEEEKELIRYFGKNIFVEATKPLVPVVEFLQRVVNKIKGVSR